MMRAAVLLLTLAFVARADINISTVRNVVHGPNDIPGSPFFGVNGTIVWSDNFTGNNLNDTDWYLVVSDDLAAGEHQMFVNSTESISIHDDALAISMTKIDGMYLSARAETKNSWSLGMMLADGKASSKLRFEATITLPKTSDGIKTEFFATNGDDIIDLVNIWQDEPSISNGGTFKFYMIWKADSIMFFAHDLAADNVYIKSDHDTKLAGEYHLVFDIVANSISETSADATTMFIDNVRVFAE
jgi:hypothetical protein